MMQTRWPYIHSLSQSDPMIARQLKPACGALPPTCEAIALDDGDLPMHTEIVGFSIYCFRLRRLRDATTSTSCLYSVASVCGGADSQLAGALAVTVAQARAAAGLYYAIVIVAVVVIFIILIHSSVSYVIMSCP